MNIVDQKYLYAARVFNGEWPKNGPKAVYTPLDFTVNGSNGQNITIDIELLEEDAKLEFVQGVFIDNRLSGQPFVFTAENSQHSQQVASGMQAYLPVFAPGSCKFTGSIPNNAVAIGPVKIQLLNFPVLPLVF